MSLNELNVKRTPEPLTCICITLIPQKPLEVDITGLFTAIYLIVIDIIEPTSITSYCRFWNWIRYSNRFGRVAVSLNIEWMKDPSHSLPANIYSRCNNVQRVGRCYNNHWKRSSWLWRFECKHTFFDLSWDQRNLWRQWNNSRFPLGTH